MLKNDTFLKVLKANLKVVIYSNAYSIGESCKKYLIKSLKEFECRDRNSLTYTIETQNETILKTYRVSLEE